MIAMKLLFTFALSAQASRVLESSATFRAKMWMKAHDPSADEAGMTDLKSTDPNAYAIVQALLTKKSLGLLDPSHPSAAFGGTAPKKHKSFQEEAEQEGLTQDSPSPAVSEMEMQSSMPYPTARTSSQPYPEVSDHHDPWNYKAVHSDDDLVNSVIGEEAPAQVQPAGDSLSLSAVSQQMQQDMPAPKREQAVAPATQNFGMPSLSWGNPMAGGASDAPASVAQPAEAESNDGEGPSLSLSAVRNQEAQKMGITDLTLPAEQPAAAAPVEAVHSPLENMALNNQLGLPSLNWDRPKEAALATNAFVKFQNLQSSSPMQPAPVSTNSYAAGSDLLSSSNPVMDAQAASEKRLEMSSFHAHVGYRMNLHANDATPTANSILALRHQTMGNSYNSFLKQARTNRWKRAMDVSLKIQPGQAASNSYLQDLS
jgi:hypothetical protein